VVPIDVRLGYDFDVMVITGPNTGGKTVTLKTVGLLTLMTMAGLHIPAAEGSRVSVFRGVWADIGDEQSIEQNLSTFSSHLGNIISIIEHVKREGGEGQLVLLDEIGAGTDPAEGASLAKALLEFFHGHKARVIATTHYSEIKAFVYERDRMTNASVEFNVGTLAPTYRLIIGLPGRSNALEISRRLGLPGEIIERARSFFQAGRGSDVPALIQRLEEDRARVSEELRAAEEASRQVRALQEEQARKWANIRADEEKVLEKAREEAREIVRQARLEAASVLDRLRETERRLLALEAAAGAGAAGDGGEAPETGEPAGPDRPAGPAPAPAEDDLRLPGESRRRLDRLEQAARDILGGVEKRASRLGRVIGEGPTTEGAGSGGGAGAASGAGPGRPPRGPGAVPDPSLVKPQETFYIAGLRHFGEVIEEPDEGGTVGVMVGSMRLTVHVSDLRVPGKAGVPDYPAAREAPEARTPGPAGAGRGGGERRETGAASGAALEKALTVSPEIHLRGLTVEEALSRLDKYLDDALLAGLETVRVIHGRGGGVLREAVADYLAEHPEVKTFHLAEQAEGGLGVTVAVLGKRQSS